MQTYTEIQTLFKIANIKINRWYTIDNFFYAVVTEINDQNKIDLNKVFKEPDYFSLYNTICIDMEKQPVKYEKVEKISKLKIFNPTPPNNFNWDEIETQNVIQ